ncbi:hypothetical protein NL676_023692 [Syzygium grande]|nr:hypothetical protein NL676_023692 [Syzygium grande]
MEARRSVIGPVVLALVIFMAVLSLRCTEATRVLPEDFARANNLASYSSSVLSEQARESMAWVEAARALLEDFVRANNLATYSSAAYETARYTMACRFGSLASGPSPRGSGH